MYFNAKISQWNEYFATFQIHGNSKLNGYSIIISTIAVHVYQLCWDELMYVKPDRFLSSVYTDEILGQTSTVNKLHTN